MSVFTKALLFTGWMICILIMFPVWAIWLRTSLGQAGTLLGCAIWLGHGAVAMWLFRCPVCGTSVFSSGKGGVVVRTPWPRTRCGHCGHDLTT